jgi:hypothetical protein
LETTAWIESLPVRLTSTAHPFLAPLGPPWPGQIDARWDLDDSNGDRTRVRVQSFCNTYRTFVLLWPPAKERFIARHRARPRIEVS